MKSCIYEGWVRHRRFTPTGHQFRYSIFLMMLDLSELEHLFDGMRGWSTERISIARFRRQDHFGPVDEPLDESVRSFVEQNGQSRPQGPVRLLTNLRYFGYVFNPVSFFYCFDQADTRVEYVVAEVHNTPWNERHCYLLPTAGSDGQPDASQPIPTTQKKFHVSPFISMDVQYSWRVGHPGQTLLMHIENRKKSDSTDQKPFFDVTMNLRRREITRGNLSRVLWRYPWMTARTTAAIYWQALQLWRKKVPFHSHPARTAQQTKAT